MGFIDRKSQYRGIMTEKKYRSRNDTAISGGIFF
jgi:hypothetical protein